MRKFHAAMFLAGLAVFAAGCRTRTEAPGSAVKAVVNNPTQTRPTWIKSPEAIEGTIVQAWGIEMSEKERWKYLQSMYSMLGGTLVQNTRSLVDQPNELFLLGLDNLSSYLSMKLVEKQAAAEGSNGDHSFDGLGLSSADAGNCFDNDANDWCDFQDSVKTNSLTKANVNAAAMPKSWRKRIMHNIQDIGEYMLLAIDNTVKMPGTDQHAAQFLLDSVFIDTLKGGPVTAEKEQAAWKNVIYTIMMSGGFYLEAPAEGSGTVVATTTPEIPVTPPDTPPPAATGTQDPPVVPPAATGTPDTPDTPVVAPVVTPDTPVVTPEPPVEPATTPDQPATAPTGG